MYLPPHPSLAPVPDIGRYPDIGRDPDIGRYPDTGGHPDVARYPDVGPGIRIFGYRPISGYPPVTRIRQNPDATGAWRTDIRIRIRHGYPDFRIRLRALVETWFTEQSLEVFTLTQPRHGLAR